MSGNNMQKSGKRAGKRKLGCILNLLVIIIAFLIVGLFSKDKTKESIKETLKLPQSASEYKLSDPRWKNELTIVSGSENKELEPILERFAKENKVSLNMVYQGSIDIARSLMLDHVPYDAVWPASSMWITMGDKNHKVKYAESVSTTPVVFGIRKSLAEKLGFTEGQVSVRDILKKIQSGELKFCMTSATQSNSGCSAYMGFLYALLDSPDMITEDMLKSPKLAEDIRALLLGVDRSSGSSEWLKTLFLNGNFDAMVNYESLILTTNKELIKQGREPLYIVYPYDGLSISDAPLGYVNQGDKQKEELFLKLKEFIMSHDVQKEIQAYGRRTGYIGIAQEHKQVWNKDWGADTELIITPIRMPEAGTIIKALNLYQTNFRKPSYTVYVLDYSGSMDGRPIEELRMAMEEILLQDRAAKNLLQASSDEINTVILFGTSIKNIETAKGNVDIENLYSAIKEHDAFGGTAMYEGLEKAFSHMSDVNLSRYNPAVILMTDGKANGEKDYKDFESYYQKNGQDIPVFCISFGKADKEELGLIAELTHARVFDGSRDLIEAFRKAKGYN
ncbi:MAG: substrate-binding and VWA domain-containing protein [Eubacteriales bacterium]|nr:substrate-binding and VWA domain-containing protein [Eubacteriales bacterium]